MSFIPEFGKKPYTVGVNIGTYTGSPENGEYHITARAPCQTCLDVMRYLTETPLIPSALVVPE